MSPRYFWISTLQSQSDVKKGFKVSKEEVLLFKNGCAQLTKFQQLHEAQAEAQREENNEVRRKANEERNQRRWNVHEERKEDVKIREEGMIMKKTKMM